MAILVTQTGVETWIRNPSDIRVSQIGVESWVHNPGSIIVSQLGIELWIFTQFIPIETVGNADGYATVQAISDTAYLTEGNADGQATAQCDNLRLIGSPLMLDMGI
jgi:hypothetical protein